MVVVTPATGTGFHLTFVMYGIGSRGGIVKEGMVQHGTAYRDKADSIS